MPHLGEIYFEDHGSGTPVLLAPGFPLGISSWPRQTAALLAAGHRVVAYDRRGSGRSGPSGSGYDYDTLAADLAALLDHLAIDGAMLAGASLGTADRPGPPARSSRPPAAR